MRNFAISLLCLALMVTPAFSLIVPVNTGIAIRASIVTLPHQEPAKLPPLPRTVSSFGADVADGWLYVYGGHCAKTHEYSTAAVLGTFQRLNLANPKAWEDLPAGPACRAWPLWPTRENSTESAACNR